MKKEEFFKFLAEHGALGSFINAFERVHLPERNMDEFLESRNPSEWIDGAFTWGQAPDHHIWKDLHEAWQDICRRSSESPSVKKISVKSVKRFPI